MNRERKKAALIEGMVRRKQWSMNYKSIENTVSKLPKREKKTAVRLIDELVDQGWAEYHKNEKCVSLRSRKRSEIRRLLEKYGEMEEWLLDSLF